MSETKQAITDMPSSWAVMLEIDMRGVNLNTELMVRHRVHLEG
jgi:hypothetical protein